MHITITPTPTITKIDGTRVRLWHGVTDSGTPCQVFVHLVSARTDHSHDDLARELLELPAPREVSLANVLGLREVL